MELAHVVLVFRFRARGYGPGGAVVKRRVVVVEQARIEAVGDEAGSYSNRRSSGEGSIPAKCLPEQFVYVPEGGVLCHQGVEGVDGLGVVVAGGGGDQEHGLGRFA